MFFSVFLCFWRRLEELTGSEPIVFHAELLAMVEYTSYGGQTKKEKKEEKKGEKRREPSYKT